MYYTSLHKNPNFPISHPNQMAATNINLLSQIFPSQPLSFQFRSHPSRSITLISCRKKKRESDLASDFAKELEKMNGQLIQRQEAMKKSRQLLFTDLCQHLDSEADDFQKKWKNLSEDDKCDLIKRFVSEWGVNFHPLSAKSVKEMVDEHLGNEDLSSVKSLGFSGLGGIMRISSKN